VTARKKPPTPKPRRRRADATTRKVRVPKTTLPMIAAPLAAGGLAARLLAGLDRTGRARQGHPYTARTHARIARLGATLTPALRAAIAASGLAADPRTLASAARWSLTPEELVLLVAAMRWDDPLAGLRGDPSPRELHETLAYLDGDATAGA
jgi:hypothetical protein